MNRTRLKAMAAFSSFVLVAGACGLSRSSDRPEETGPKSGKYGEGLLKASPSPTQTQAAGGSTPSATKATSKSSTKSTTQSSGTRSAAVPPGSIADFGPYGYTGSGRYLMAPQPYPEIVIEVDYVAGREPTNSALEYLVETVADVTGKKVTLAPLTEIPRQGGRYDGEAIVEASRKHRETRSSDGKASIWVGYLDGTMRGGGAAGVAVAGTVTAVFLDTIQDLPFPPTTKVGIEKTILLQEVGHLFGLVNIGYRSPRDHEDKDHPGHSKNPASVMYWALMTREGLLTFIGNGGTPPSKFDADDLADLKDIAAGRFG